MICIFGFLCLAGLSLGLEVHQSHSDLIKQVRDKVQISCSHGKTDYTLMLWYQKFPGDTAMKLIGYLNYGTPSIEESYQKDFNMSGDLSGSTAKNASLIIQTVDQSHTAVYYCAASYEQGNAEAYFGKGTKLTVLEHDVAYPTVNVFYPSGDECRDYYRTKKRTLLCVASDFYPDHVSVSWKRNGRNITNGVATDPAAKKDGEKYKISSRLKIPLEEWVDQNNKYTCIVKFYNGTHHLPYSDTITVRPNEIAITRGYYMRVTQNAKVSYTVLIVKSCVYGAFVCFLVWKLQGKRGKQRK